MLLILTIGIGTVVSGINPYIYGKIVDSISEKNTFFLKKWLLLLGIVLIATLILEIVESMLGNWLTNTTENQIKSELLYADHDKKLRCCSQSNGYLPFYQ